MSNTRNTLISTEYFLFSLAQVAKSLLPCDTVLILDLHPDPTVLAQVDCPNPDHAAFFLEGCEHSSGRLSADGGVQAGLFPNPIDDFQSWASKPLDTDRNRLILCLNRSCHPFESSALTRLAALPSLTENDPGEVGSRLRARPPSGITALTRYLDTRIVSSEISVVEPLALLRLDLGRIGPINDSDGWPVSDALIDEAYALLQTTAPPSCFTVHLGGGSFAIVVPLENDIQKAEKLAEDILIRMTDPTQSPPPPSNLEPYIGWAAFPYDSPDTDTLIGFANAALARIRGTRTGPRINRVAPEIAHVHAEQIGMEADLREAIAHGAFTINWLPVLETGTEQVIAFEALARWNRPGHGQVDPAIFLTCAEQAGLIEDIDRWILRHACARAAAWKQPFGVSVNVSPSWLATERVASTVSDALSESGLDPARLQIELSERRSFGASESARKELARIRSMGVRLVLDDFGTGFGALERLTNYPFDQVKLDRMFVKRLGTDSRVETILRCTLYMIHALNMTCCAEGVETEEQLGFLDAHGCEEIQGYLIGRPSIQAPD